MANDSVVLRLGIDARGAVSGFAQFEKGGQRVIRTAGKVDQSLRKTTKSIKGLGSAATSARGTIASLFGGITGALVLRSGVQAIASFERSIAILGVVTEATTSQLSTLSAKARDLGADTQFTANQVARGMVELARIGFTTNEILAAIPRTLDLTIVAEGNLAEVSKIAATSMRTFRLEAEDMERVVDTLTHTANSSGTTIQELGQALRFVGPSARAFGATIEETTAFLGVMADRSLRGTLGGTALRAMFIRLQKPTSEAREGLDLLGLSVREVNPSVVSLTEVFQNLSDAIERVGPEEGLRAFTKLFGRRQISGALIGVVPEALEKIKNLQQEMALLDRATDRAARTIEDTLVGAFFELKAAMEAIALSAGQEGLLGGMRSLVDTLTDVARALAGMTDKIEGNQEVIIAVAKWIKTLGIAFAATFSLRILGIIGKFAFAIKGLVAVGTLGAAATLATSFGAVVGALKLIGLGLIIFRDKTIEVGEEVFTLAEIVGVTFGVITDIAVAAGDVISEFWGRITTSVTNSIEENASVWAKVFSFFDERFRNVVGNFAGFRDKSLSGSVRLDQLKGEPRRRAEELIPEAIKQEFQSTFLRKSDLLTNAQELSRDFGRGIVLNEEADRQRQLLKDAKSKKETLDFLLTQPRAQNNLTVAAGFEQEITELNKVIKKGVFDIVELAQISEAAYKKILGEDISLAKTLGLEEIISVRMKELRDAKARIAGEKADRLVQQEKDRIEEFTDTHPFLTDIQRKQSFAGITSADLVAETFAPGLIGESQLAELDKLERKARQAHQDRIANEKEFRDAILNRATVHNKIEDIIIRIHKEKHALLLTEDQLFKIEELQKVEAELMVGVLADDKAARTKLLALVGEELDAFIKARNEREKALKIEEELISAREKAGGELKEIAASLADELFILKKLRADPLSERDVIEQALHLERTAVEEVTGQYLLLEQVIDRLSEKQIKGIENRGLENIKNVNLISQETAGLKLDRFDIQKELGKTGVKGLSRDLGNLGKFDFQIRSDETVAEIQKIIDQIEKLEKAHGGATEASRMQKEELNRIKEVVPGMELAASSAEFLSQTIGGPLSTALTDIVTGVSTAGEAFRNFAINVLGTIVQTLIQAMIDALVKLIIQMAVAAAFGGVNPLAAVGTTAATAAVPSRRGNVFTGGASPGDLGFMAFAEGGIVNKPTRALMGEAGPEAVLPLKRGGDGKLGVTVHGLLSEELANQRTLDDLNVLTLQDIAQNIKSNFQLIREEIRAVHSPKGEKKDNGIFGSLLFGVQGGKIFEQFGDGGLVRKPTLALIGDKGPELITPLKDIPQVAAKPKEVENKRPVVINFVVNATDPAAFRRSRTQIARDLRVMTGGFG